MGHWVDRAACRDVDPREFDTPDGIRHCRLCPVKAQCALDALTHGDVEVVRAGVFLSATSPGKSRTALRRAARGYRPQ